MLYWCEAYAYSNGFDDGDGYDYGDAYDDGYGYAYGYNYELDPAVLVTGVTLEEVVLNAVLV